MASDPISRLHNAVAETLLPPPALLLSEWARKKFVLSSDYSAATGNFEPYPYQIEPLDVLSSSNPAEMMCLMCGAQMMKTLLMMILLGAVIDADPGPVLIVQPNIEDAKAFSSERIAPMLADIPCLRGKVHEAKSRDAGNTILRKRFNGGSVSLTGTVTPRGLRRRSVRYLLLDEIDGYQDTRDGDPVALAAARTSKFWNRKIVLCSTPTVEGRSRIAKFFGESDRRLYFVPCPFCGEMQTLDWHGVRWGFVDEGADGKPNPNGRFIAPEDAQYRCSGCREFIPHHHKLGMLRAGQWRATNPEGKYPGFRISRLYAPDWSWGKIVTDPAEGWLAAQNDPAALMVFFNNILAETWQDRGEAPDWQLLLDRREDGYQPGTVPAGGLFLTVGADIHPDRIEAEVVAWGKDKQSWSVAYEIFEGRTSEPLVWQGFSAFLERTFPHVCGAQLSISRAFVDSGYATNDVYAWARNQRPDQVTAVKGDDRGALPVSQPSFVDVTIEGKKYENGLRIKTVKVSFFKSEFYSNLKKRPPTDEERAEGLGYPPGYCHFPKGRNYGDEHFKQLCSEELITRRNPRTKRIKTEWVQGRERNEALDARLYARAAAWDYGLDQAQEIHWQALEASLKPKPADPEPTMPQMPPPQPKDRFVPRRNWFNR